MHILRKNKGWLMIVIAVPIAFTMLFFGIPAFWEGGGQVFEDIAVAEVGGIPVYAFEYQRNLDFAASRAARGGAPPTYAELVETGVADQVLQEMIGSALIRLEEQERGMHFEPSYLEDRLKQEPTFQNENGAFDATIWNAWIERNQGMDWDAVFADVAEQAAREIYMKSVLAPAGRVPDSEVERLLGERYTKLTIKYAKLEPQVELSEEELRDYYEENPDRYTQPEQKVAEFVRISLQSEPGENVAKVLADARAGMEFSAIQEKYTDAVARDTGEMTWVAPDEAHPDHLQKAFELQAGEVSEPIPAPSGFYIYKVLEERTNEETGDWEILPRRLFLPQPLPEEERQARIAQAEALAAAAEEQDNLAAAAAGQPVLRTGTFDFTSMTIENVADADARQFAGAFRAPSAEDEEGFKVVRGPENIYVAQVVEESPGSLQSYEEVLDRVKQDAVADFKMTDGYRERLTELGERIKAEAANLEEAAQKFPDLQAVKETEPFTGQDNLFQQQVYIPTQQIFAELADKEPGTMAGPISSFLGESYFIELTSKTLPTEEDKAKWPEEKKELRTTMVQQQESALLQDYLTNLRERVLPTVAFSIDDTVRQQVLGLETAAPPAADEAPATDTAPAEAAADAQPETESAEASS